MMFSFFFFCAIVPKVFLFLASHERACALALEIAMCALFYCVRFHCFIVCFRFRQKCVRRRRLLIFGRRPFSYNNKKCFFDVAFSDYK